MKKVVMSGMAALGIALAPAAIAQTTTGSNAAMASEQRAVYDSWPAEQQRTYDAMNRDMQLYFWTLQPNEQAGWWALNDDQRMRLYAMTPEQRTAAWNSINAQMAGMTNPAATTTARTTSSYPASGNIQYVSGPVVQGNLSPVATQPAEYPVCNSDQDDSCINPYAAGRRGPNVERPLPYWPGEES